MVTEVFGSMDGLGLLRFIMVSDKFGASLRVGGPSSFVLAWARVALEFAVQLQALCLP